MTPSDLPPLKIVYAGDLQRGGTCRERMESLIELGHEVTPLDMRPYYFNAPRWQRVIEHRLRAGPSVAAMNRDLAELCRGGCDWLWVDKGIWIYPETLLRFREACRATLIHYTPDPAITFHRTRHFMRCLPLYDFLVTNKRYELDLYREHGARHVIWSCTAFSRGIFRPVEVRAEDHARFDCDLVFVGHCEPHYVEQTQAAVEAVPNAAIWGKWQRVLPDRPWLQKVWRGPGVWHEDYVKALKCAKIGLGLLTRLAPDRATTRSMEIPAAGTFMLAERTEEHQELFEEGREAEFFDSRQELQDKLRFYVKNDEARRRIAEAGHRRAMESGYSYQDRIRQVVEQIRAALSASPAAV